MSLRTLPFLSATAALLTATAWAAPDVLWEGNFSADGQQVTKNGVTYTLHLNGNEIKTADDGSTYIDITGSTHDSCGVTVDVGTVPTSNPGGTVIIRYSDAKYNGTDVYGTIMSLCCDKTGGYTNITSLTVADANGTLHGQWGEGYWSDKGCTDSSITDTTIAQDATTNSLALSYANGSGTYAYQRKGSGSWAAVYRLNGYGSGTYNIMGFSVGGQHTQPCSRSNAFANNCHPVEGMKIYAVAYEAAANTSVSALSSSFSKWPSEITTYTTTTDVSGTVNWSDITFDSTWVSSDASIANITLTGDATITLPADFQAHTINFTGDYAVTLISSGTELASIGTITGGSSITRVIPTTATAAITVPAGQIYTLAGTTEEGVSNTYSQVFTVNGTLALTGNLALSGANTINGSGAVLEVQSGTTYLTTAGCGLSNSGKIKIDEGATLAAQTTDTGNYNGSGWTVDVYGTLDFGTSRWTIMGSNTSLNLYGVGKVIGTGDAYGAIDLHSKISAYAVSGSTNQSRIEAPIKWTTAGATVWVADGANLTIASTPNQNNSYFTKTGLGTLTLAAAQKLTGAQAVYAGTLEFACASAITGSATIAADATLKITDGTYDVSTWTINGTLLIAGGTVATTSTATNAVNFTSGTLKVSVTDTEWASGVTLGDNFTVAEGQNVTFVHGTTEATGTGKVLAAQGVTWTGTAGDGKWATAGNWSGNAVPATTDVVKFTADAEVILTTDDVAPAGVLISDGATLTINGAGSLGGVMGGKLVKKGEGALNVSKNGDGYSFNGTAVTIEEGSIYDPGTSETNIGKLKNLDLTLASGTTMKCYGWPGCEGTMTVSCTNDVEVFENLGNSANSLKLVGLTSFVKKGAGTLTLKAVLVDTTIDIQEGKLVMCSMVNSPSGLTLTGSGELALNMSSGTSMAAPTLSSFTGTITGTGTLVHSGSLPDKTIATYYQADTWTGTVKIENKTGLTGFNPNNYGNANSKIILSGVEGYFVQSNTTHLEIKPTIEFADGSYGFGLKISNGWGTDWVQFDKVTGSGTYMMTPPNNANNPTRRHFFPDVTEFTGALVLTGTNASSVKNVSTIFVGRDWTDYSDDAATVNGKVFISGTLPTAVSARNEIGDIVVSAGATATKSQLTAADVVSIAGTVTTTSAAAQAIGATNRIDVASSGVLEFVTTANQNDTYAVFTNITGTGTIKYSGTGWHTLPAYSTNIWANTLGVCIEQTDGMILQLCRTNTEDDVFLYEIGSLSGTKDIRVDWTDVADSRSLRVTQSKDTEWSGKIMPCSSTRDRFNSLIVAGVEGATNTLTISGTNFDAQCSNTLAIEATGSVNLTGNWVGDVTVDGILSGTGTASGSITFNSTGKLLCTPGETICLGTLATGTDVSAIQVAIPEGTALTESSYMLMTFSEDQETIPSFTFVNAADYPMYKIVVTSKGLKLTKSGFTIIIL